MAQRETPPTDGLLDRLRAGEAGAYRELMRRYERRVFAFCYGFLRDEDETMDAVQDTFVKVFRKLETFRGEAQLSTWIFRIARNLCIDKCRRKARVPMDEFDETRDHAPDPLGGPLLVGEGSTNNPGRDVLRAELRSVILEAVDDLSEAHREIVLLREVEGLAYSEIAEVLEVPIGTVMSRLYHARKNLQRRIGRYLNPQQGARHGA